MVSDTLRTVVSRIDLDSPPLADTFVLSLAAFLWLVLLEGWLPGLGPAPADLEAPMDAPGVPEAMATANGLTGVTAYLLIWGTMMLAMMLPSLVPAVRRYREEICDDSTLFIRSIAAFLGAYGLVWTLVGAVPLAVQYVVPIHDLVTESALGWSAGSVVVAGLFAFAGGYQFTSLKRDLLERCACCRSIPHHPDVTRMVRTGLEYAVNCVGCTWPLFAVMVALGSMNLSVMIGLTVVVVLERVAPESDDVALAWGVVLLAAAAFTLLVGVPSV
ncbi:DUF2182 domain-containing protein [Halosolutus gelatinilyticus]|uniref:DUF2182 domain-containing protein n=1 Tax=Halosolutus gelatinilyticus TaxID=2931975 RepID=UPI001FF30FF2|nr:DUF2182 domain-containing protein [Halosolutus gelatinilyticus]